MRLIVRSDFGVCCFSAGCATCARAPVWPCRNSAEQGVTTTWTVAVCRLFFFDLYKVRAILHVTYFRGLGTCQSLAERRSLFVPKSQWCPVS